MSSTIVVLDVEVEAIAWVSGNQGLRVRTRRWARPTRARFDAWLSIGWPSLEIEFVWCPPLERRVRTMFVVPIGERKKLAARLLTTQRDQHSSRALDLHRLDHALNHSEAVDRPTSGIDRGILRQRDDVQHGRADMLGPGFRERNAGCFLGRHRVLGVGFISAPLEHDNINSIHVLRRNRRSRKNRWTSTPACEALGRFQVVVVRLGTAADRVRSVPRDGYLGHSAVCRKTYPELL